MKRILALLIALVMLLSLTACGKDGEGTPTGESTTNTSDATTNSTEETTEPIPTDSIPTDSIPTESTQSDHTHSYSSNVTKSATCTDKGVKTFTCSCGETYTEDINATGHSMGGWKAYPASSKNVPAEKRNSCANCNYYESEKQYAEMLEHYAKVVNDLGYFVSAQAKQNSLDSVITAAYRNGVQHKISYVNNAYINTITVADMNAFTTAYLGTTYNYTGVKDLPVLDGARCSYDAKAKTLVITGNVAGSGGSASIDGVEFTTKDDVHFLVTVKHPGTHGNPWKSEMSVALIDGRYIITSYNVSAENQMINSEVVSFLGNADAPLKILVLGNSITRHGPKEDIGWPHDWGMAASALEKDYVHRLYAKLTEGGNDVYMRIRQASSWERNFTNSDCLDEFEDEKLFDADIIIFRLAENVLAEEYPYLEEGIVEFMEYLSSDDTTIIFTASFMWNPTCDQIIKSAANRMNSPYVDISCTDDRYLAYDQFEHPGVQLHPGDSGMEMIASRIYEKLLSIIN